MIERPIHWGPINLLGLGSRRVDHGQFQFHHIAGIDTRAMKMKTTPNIEKLHWFQTTNPTNEGISSKLMS